MSCCEPVSTVLCVCLYVARFNFEDVNTLTTLVEGVSAQVCVVLVSGVISVPIEVRVETGETFLPALCKWCIGMHGVHYSTFIRVHLNTVFTHEILFTLCFCLSPVPADFLFAPPPDPQDGAVHLLFSAGDQRKCLSLTGVEDMLSEGTENIALTLITTDGSAGTKGLTLLDRDSECTVSTHHCILMRTHFTQNYMFLEIIVYLYECAS